MINFDSNNFSLLSKEVSLVMQESLEKCQEFRNSSFGYDQFVKAEIEKARYQIAWLLNANAQMLFFDASDKNSDIGLLLPLLTILDIRLIITSQTEDKDKIDFLNQICSTGKIGLKFIDSNNHGRFNTDQLAEITSSENQRILVTLSHANRNTGELLHIKDIVSICNVKNTFFHLNTNLTVGKYQIDFEKLKPDFMSFSSHLMNGPVGIGGIILNPSPKLKQDNFNLIYRYLQINESKNLSLILGFEMALSQACNNLESYQKKVSDLKDYFTNKLKSTPKIKILGLENGKKGLINLITIILNTSDFGKYIKEKLELKGIAVDYIIPENNQTNDLLIHIALNELIAQPDVDFLIECLNSMRKD